MFSRRFFHCPIVTPRIDTRVIFLLIASMSFFTVGAVEAGSCTLIGSKKTPAIIGIYEETTSADLGRLIWQGTLEKDERIPIIHAGYRIRYRYKGSFDAQWSVHEGILCNNHEKLSLP